MERYRYRNPATGPLQPLRGADTPGTHRAPRESLSPSCGRCSSATAPASGQAREPLYGQNRL